jgi:hypothetical protein
MAMGTLDQAHQADVVVHLRKDAAKTGARLRLALGRTWVNCCRHLCPYSRTC